MGYTALETPSRSPGLTLGGQTQGSLPGVPCVPSLERTQCTWLSAVLSSPSPPGQCMKGAIVLMAFLSILLPPGFTTGKQSLRPLLCLHFSWNMFGNPHCLSLFLLPDLGVVPGNGRRAQPACPGVWLDLDVPGSSAAKR